MSNPHQPWQQIVMKSQCKRSPRKREKRDAFCTIDKKNLCEPRFKLTAIIQLRFYLSRERDWKLKLGDLFPWDLDKGERKVCLNTSKSSIWCFYLKNTCIFITLRLDCNKTKNISLFFGNTRPSYILQIEFSYIFMKTGL